MSQDVDRCRPPRVQLSPQGRADSRSVSEPKPGHALVRRSALECDLDRPVGHGVRERADPRDRLGTKRREVAVGETRPLRNAERAPPGAPVAAVQNGPQCLAVLAPV